MNLCIAKEIKKHFEGYAKRRFRRKKQHRSSQRENSWTSKFHAVPSITCYWTAFGFPQSTFF